MTQKLYVVVTNEPEDAYSLQAYLRGVFDDYEVALAVAKNHLPYWLAQADEQQKIQAAKKFIVTAQLNQLYDINVRVAYHVG
ncbi:MAG TPA: hypothetical protein VGM95_02545 [Lactobacillaceae bacterium]|jgi:hypothetical protein